MQSNLLVHGILAAEDPSPVLIPAFIILFREEVCHQVIIITFTSLASLKNWEDALDGLLLPNNTFSLHL